MPEDDLSNLTDTERELLHARAERDHKPQEEHPGDAQRRQAAIDSNPKLKAVLDDAMRERERLQQKAEQAVAKPKVTAQDIADLIESFEVRKLPLVARPTVRLTPELVHIELETDEITTAEINITGSDSATIIKIGTTTFVVGADHVAVISSATRRDSVVLYDGPLS